MDWIAQRDGHDWRDEDVFAAIDWLTSLVPGAEWDRRVEAVEQRFQAAKLEWAAGRRVPLFDPADTIAWYVHQARRYADPLLRPDCFIPESYRIAPLFQRIGQLVPAFRSMQGAEARAARLMTENTSQPDDGIYELLVAGAYARRGWDDVRFVDEAPGIAKRHDLLVDRPGASWAIECKRAGRSGYAQDERVAGERMAARAHELSRSSGRSLLVMAQFSEELHQLDESYLAEKVEHALAGEEPYEWRDSGGGGVVFEAILGPLQAVMAHDDVYFGSTRMLEVLTRNPHSPAIDFTVDGDWTPAEGRPLHATWVDRVSAVLWRSTSAEADRRKSMHFRGLVGRASEQLPGDRPGVIHVGYEAVGGNSADARRHELNARQMLTFNPGDTGLRMVYGNYFMPEMVTARDESAAVTETLAWYPVGPGEVNNPLPGHMLFMDEDGQPGSHL